MYLYYIIELNLFTNDFIEHAPKTIQYTNTVKIAQSHFCNICLRFLLQGICLSPNIAMYRMCTNFM